jgi:hypothetical protein
MLHLLTFLVPLQNLLACDFKKSNSQQLRLDSVFFFPCTTAQFSCNKINLSLKSTVPCTIPYCKCEWGGAVVVEKWAAYFWIHGVFNLLIYALYT